MQEFWSWWQHLPQHISPVIFQIGAFKLQYYGLMYIVAFAITYGLVMYRLKRESRFHVSGEQVNDLTTAIILGLMIGARLGYVVFYNLSYYLKHPLEIFLPFEFSNGITFTGISGMSYHGGVIGILIAGWLYTRKNAISLRDVADLYIPGIPLGYTFGRVWQLHQRRALRPGHHGPDRHVLSPLSGKGPAPSLAALRGVF